MCYKDDMIVFSFFSTLYVLLIHPGPPPTPLFPSNISLKTKSGFGDTFHAEGANVGARAGQGIDIVHDLGASTYSASALVSALTSSLSLALTSAFMRTRFLSKPGSCFQGWEDVARDACLGLQHKP